MTTVYSVNEDSSVPSVTGATTGTGDDRTATPPSSSDNIMMFDCKNTTSMMSTTAVASLPSKTSKSSSSDGGRLVNTSAEFSLFGDKSSRSKSSDTTTVGSGLNSGGGQLSSFVKPETSRIGSNVGPVFKLQFASLGLYGRTNEGKVLTCAFKRIISGSSTSGESYNGTSHKGQHQEGGKSIVLVSGYSGTGKSALVRQTLHKATQNVGGFYISGKFDLQHRDQIPFSAIASACNELCEQIESIEESVWGRKCPQTLNLRHIQNKLTTELGTEKHLLIRIIPGLQRIFRFETDDDIDDIQNHHKNTESEFCVSGGKRNGREKETEEEAATLIDSRHRFNYAFRRLMRVITTFGPIVLFLDDLQWCDTASLDLLEVLITDPQLHRFLLVGSYRSNEVDDTHLVSKFIRDTKNQLKVTTSKNDIDSGINSDDKNDSHSVAGSLSSATRHSVKLDEIKVGELTLDAVNELLSDLLWSDVDNTQELANIVWSKTHGNVFYVIELLRDLQARGYLKCNLGSTKWEWDEEEIKHNTQDSVNVADLVKRKIVTKLPTDIAVLLPIAACLGCTFDPRIFDLVVHNIQPEELKRYVDMDELSTLQQRAVSEQTGAPAGDGDEQINPIDCIQLCESEGLVVQRGTGENAPYGWSHDKVQEAAFDLIKEEEMQSFLYYVGDILLKRLETIDLQGSVLFVVVDLLSHGIGTTTMQKPKLIQLCELNLAAGEKAMSLCAFQSASRYFDIALNLLPETHWTHHYELSHKIYTSSAEAAYCLSNFDRMHSLCDEVISQEGHPLEDKFPVYKLVCEGLVQGGKYVEAEKACIRTLELVGCKFPKSDFLRTVSTVTGAIKAKMLIQKYSEAEVQRLPRCEDKTIIFANNIMEILAESAVVTGSKILALPLLRQLSWIFKYGFTDESNLVFGGVALIMTAIMGDLQIGKKCCQFSFAVHDKAKAKRTVARHVTCTWGLTLHLLEPFSLCMKHCLIGYQAGLEMGDVLYGSWDIQFYLMLGQRSGKSLISIEHDYSIYTNAMKLSVCAPVYAFAAIHWQTVQNLIGHASTDSSNPLELTGDVMDENEMLSSLTRANNKMAIHLLNNRKLYLGCILGEHEVAADIAVEMGESFYQENPGSPSFIDQFLFGALSCISTFRVTKRTKYLSFAKNQAKKIKGWLKQGSRNFIQWSLLLEAELMALRGKTKKSKEAFEGAVKASARLGRVHEQALIRERYAAFLLSCNDTEDHGYQLRKAVSLYEEWGAMRKVNRMAKVHQMDHLPEISIVITNEQLVEPL